MPKNDKSYQELQTELDEIMVKLQASEIDAEEALKLYEDGLEIIKQLRARLTSVENKVTKLRAEH